MNTKNYTQPTPIQPALNAGEQTIPDGEGLNALPIAFVYQNVIASAGGAWQSQGNIKLEIASPLTRTAPSAMRCKCPSSH